MYQEQWGEKEPSDAAAHNAGGSKSLPSRGKHSFFFALLLNASFHILVMYPHFVIIFFSSCVIPVFNGLFYPAEIFIKTDTPSWQTHAAACFARCKIKASIWRIFVTFGKLNFWQTERKLHCYSCNPLVNYIYSCKRYSTKYNYNLSHKSNNIDDNDMHNVFWDFKLFVSFE